MKKQIIKKLNNWFIKSNDMLAKIVREELNKVKKKSNGGKE